MRKQAFCICENKDADQLSSNCKTDNRLYFRYMFGTIPLLCKSKISSLYPSSVHVQLGLCQNCSEPKMLVFSYKSPYMNVWKCKFGNLCPIQNK